MIVYKAASRIRLRIMRTCDTAMSQLIMPMGCLKWIFHRKRPFDVNGRTDLHAQAQAVGPYDKAIHVDSTEDLEMITVFFQPYAAKLIMDIPGREFCNGVCDFDNDFADFQVPTNIELPMFNLLRYLTDLNDIPLMMADRVL